MGERLLHCKNSLKEAEKILEQFVSKGEGRRIKNINHWDYEIGK